VPDASDSTPLVRRAVFTVDAELLRLWSEVLEYVETWHWAIDPEMYRIDVLQLAALKRLFHPGDARGKRARQIGVTRGELFALRLIRDAADGYSHRSRQPRLETITDTQLKALDDWITSAARWFVSPLDHAD